MAATAASVAAAAAASTAKPITRIVAEQIWHSYQKSFGYLSTTRLVNDAWEKSPYHTANFCISEDASALEASRRFCNENVGCLIATNEKGRMSGVLSERDIVLKIGLLDRDASQIKIKDIFTPPPYLILAKPFNTLEDCLERITDNDVDRLPILDDAADIVGMVCIKDCIRTILEDKLTLEQRETASL